VAAAPALGGGDFGLSDLLDEVGVKQKATGENACPSCGAFLAPEAVLCVECGYNRKSGKKLQVETVKKVEAKKLGPPTAAAKAAAGKKPGSGGASSMPWEDAGGDIGAMISTVQAILSSPQEAFARLRPDGLRLALGYFFTTNLLIGFLLALLVGGVLALLFGNQSLAIPGIGAAIAVAYVVIAGSISLGLYALILHGLLKVVGGANKSLKTTFQVLAYCGGAANLVALIPCVNFLTFLIAFYSMPVGLAAAHETSLAKSYIALVLYIVLAFLFQLALSVALQVAVQQFLPDMPQGAAG
jgi:hypothetical protein